MFDTTNINYISIKDLFWFKVQGHLISFGSPLLPKDIHYTIAYNETSSFVNIHLTKNIKAVSSVERKPTIGIVKIEKKELKEFSELITWLFLQKILKPFDFDAFKKRNRQIGFLSFEKLQAGKAEEIIKMGFVQEFRKISKIENKNRLKIKGDISKSLRRISQSRAMRKIFSKNVRRINQLSGKKVEAGLLVSICETVNVIRINKSWYEIELTSSVIEILTSVTNENIAKKLIQRAKRAIVQLNKATSFQEVEKDSVAPQLFLKKQENL